jgi:predicted HD phosphohydrolase
MEQVKFTEMQYGDEEDYAFLHPLEVEFASHAGERIFDSLAALDSSFSGYQISRLGHSVQSATRAWRDGADIDWVVCALLHDIGDMYAPYNHDEYAAVIMRPFIREQCAWTTEVHGEFQKYFFADKLGGNKNSRDKYLGQQYFDDCADFCERWDQTSFDPNYEDLPIEFFRPMVIEVFSRTPYDPDVIRPGAREPLVNDAVAAKRRDAA